MTTEAVVAAPVDGQWTVPPIPAETAEPEPPAGEAAASPILAGPAAQEPLSPPPPPGGGAWPTVLKPNWRTPSLDDEEPEDEESDNAIELRQTIPAWRNALDLVSDKELEPPRFVVTNLLHQGMVMVVGGPSKAGKTFILLQLALAVAAERNFLKWPAGPGRVLFVNGEIPEPFLKKRLKDLCVVMKANEDRLKNIEVLTLRGHRVCISKLVPELISRIKPGDFDLVVIDPIYKFYGDREENSASGVGDLCTYLGMLATKTKAAVAYVAHFSKGNQAARQSLDRMSGSGVFARDADAILTLTPHKQDNCYVVESILRNCPPETSFVIEQKFPPAVVRENLSPADLLSSAGAKAKQAQRNPLTVEQFLELFPELDADDPESGLFTSLQLRDEYQRRDWQRAEAKACCDQAIKKGLIEVAPGAHGAKFHGRPDVVAAYLARKKEAA